MCDLNETSKNIFKKENRDIQLSYILYSTMENTEFKVISNYFYGGDHIFSDDYYLHFGIKGKNDINENWNLLNKAIGEKNYYIALLVILIMK